MIRSVFSALVLLSAVGATAQAPNAEAPAARPTVPPTPATPAVLRIAAWNLEHFVDPYDDPHIVAEQEDSGKWKGEQGVEKLAAALHLLNADIIAFQEVESDRAVKLFMDTHVPDHGMRYWASVPSVEWYQNTVVASRYPMGPITSWREVEMANELEGRRENKYNSRLLAVEIRAGDYVFDLVNVHLKAGGEPKDSVWRTEQIKLVQDWCVRQTAADPNRNIIILGDTNLTPTSDEYKFWVPSERYPLVDPAEEMGFPATHPADKPRRRIDQIFLNPAMAPEYVPASLAVPQPLPLDDMKAISDHLPVLILIKPN